MKYLFLCACVAFFVIGICKPTDYAHVSRWVGLQMGQKEAVKFFYSGKLP